MNGTKLYYLTRWTLWNAGFFTLAILWLSYGSASAGNVLRFLMGLSLFGQFVCSVGFDSASVESKLSATKSLVFSKSFWSELNYTSDLALCLVLAFYGRWSWCLIGASSMLFTQANIGSRYDFRAELKSEEKPEPATCGCQHCN